MPFTSTAYEARSQTRSWGPDNIIYPTPRIQFLRSSKVFFRGASQYHSLFVWFIGLLVQLTNSELVWDDIYTSLTWYVKASFILKQLSSVYIKLWYIQSQKKNIDEQSWHHVEHYKQIRYLHGQVLLEILLNSQHPKHSRKKILGEPSPTLRKPVFICGISQTAIKFWCWSTRFKSDISLGEKSAAETCIQGAYMMQRSTLIMYHQHLSRSTTCMIKSCYDRLLW